MTLKRRILEQLGRDDLIAAVDRFELSVADRRVRNQLIDALVGSRKATLADILDPLSRDQLKELCRALDFDDRGRSKAELVARLLGEEPAPAEAPARAAKPIAAPAPSAAPVHAPTEGDPQLALPAVAPAAKGKLTRAELERELWSAADILRGSIDSSDYKSYIFGLLFLKRLSDRFDEECELLIAEGQDPEDRDEHTFYVPPQARWRQIQKATTDLGEVLNQASAALEEANAILEGVLAGMDYNDERRLGDGKQRDIILHKLVKHFSKVDLRNGNLSEPDMLGRAYEYLIEKFADDAGKKGGEFYTPHMVVRLIVEILVPNEGMRICDPTCGSGGMLIQSAQYIAERGGRPGNVSLYGQEKNLGTWAICKMNMLLHGYPDAKIEKGDTIRDPKLVDAHDRLMQFDRVIANPPFSLDSWGHEMAAGDPFGRFSFGVPPKSKGDLAFVQHMVATLDEKRHGMLGVVMPHGVLFRGGSEAQIRRGFIEEDDLLEAVVGLPSNLFYGTPIPAAILVMRRGKPAERKGKVLFVDTSRDYGQGTNQNHLRDEDVAKIAAAVHAFSDVPRYARVVSVDEIAGNDFNLNISRYIDTSESEEKADVAAAVVRLRELEKARDEATVVMDGFLKELGYDEA
jgi:type I restriction enzyme M protein